MSQDFTTAFVAVQAEQRLIARRAERAWMIEEAKSQGRFVPRESALSRLGAALGAATRRLARRPAVSPSVTPAARQRSAGAV